MKKILLMGNPNVGKSVFFSRLTGIHVMTSNYPGTTVGYESGFLKVKNEIAEIVDVPGTYSLEPTCKAEDVACEMLKQSAQGEIENGDIIINVVDATNLERNLYLTLELLERKIPVIIALNLWDEARHHGVKIDHIKLGELLGVPVVPTVAVTGEGFKELIEKIDLAKSPETRECTREKRWQNIGKIISEVQTIRHKHHTFWEALEEMTIKPITGIPFALFIGFVAFKVIRFIGEGIISHIAEPLFNNIYTPLIMKISQLLGSGGLIHDVIVGKLINGEIDYVQSFGLLSTGLFVPLAMVLPYIISFYLILGILEDSGYLPRLAVLMDNLMHRIGLHGYAIIPTLLGLGCNVPGILATRILESRRERFIASTLISIGIPCAALQAMIIGVLGDYGIWPVAIVYLTLFFVWLMLGYIINKFIPGFSPELLIEIPPYRLPPIKVLFKKLWWRTKAFIKEALPIVLIGVFVVNILYLLGIFNIIADITAPLVTGLWGLPKEAVVAIAIGFLRKDVAVGMFAPLNMTLNQLIVGSIILSMFFPCIATFIILLKELGLKDLIKATAIMIVSSLIVGGLLNFILST